MRPVAETGCRMMRLTAGSTILNFPRSGRVKSIRSHDLSATISLIATRFFLSVETISIWSTETGEKYPRLALRLLSVIFSLSRMEFRIKSLRDVLPRSTGASNTVTSKPSSSFKIVLGFLFASWLPSVLDLDMDFIKWETLNITQRFPILTVLSSRKPSLVLERAGSIPRECFPCQNGGNPRFRWIVKL